MEIYLNKLIGYFILKKFLGFSNIISQVAKVLCDFSWIGANINLIVIINELILERTRPIVWIENNSFKVRIAITKISHLFLIV